MITLRTGRPGIFPAINTTRKALQLSALLPHHFIYLFLDGIGLAPAGPDNPFAPVGPDSLDPMPFLNGVLGTPLLAGPEIHTSEVLFKPVDATLGVPGRPQSATGQAALYTGRNAPAFLGRHLTGFANGSLRILLEESGMFKQILALGGRATAANLYTPAYFQAIENRKLRYSVGALLNITAGVPFRMPEDYERGEALFWDITNRYSSSRGFELPIIAPQEAGRRLARLAEGYEVTLFESYLPDYAGHAQDMDRAREVLREVDGLIEGIMLYKSPGTTLVICSDHGNIEYLGSRLHTLNPVPLLVFGPAAPAFGGVETIMGLVPVIVDQLKLTIDTNKLNR
ncbi:MAG: hypothetical protein JWP00_613 [Chloroflexi bacterium]|nr:hypothetical protein [Chloroflexota bacterium]